MFFFCCCIFFSIICLLSASIHRETHCFVFLAAIPAPLCLRAHYKTRHQATQTDTEEQDGPPGGGNQTSTSGSLRTRWTGSRSSITQNGARASGIPGISFLPLIPNPRIIKRPWEVSVLDRGRLTSRLEWPCCVCPSDDLCRATPHGVLSALESFIMVDLCHLPAWGSAGKINDDRSSKSYRSRWGL